MMADLVVSVKQGKLQGSVKQSVLGSPYIAFKAIPFAAPPLGTLRFKDPQPPASWSGIRDASTVSANVCPQIDEFSPNNIIGDEDCLYLNVYTTSLKQSKPVMFWIHGGGFVVGTGSDVYIRPDYLITKDIVLVTTNYRLGAFGFLNLEHEVASGNQALKDVIAALNWVKENITNFGGDPNNVTIFGNSAGGALTHALTITPSAEGLFHKAIFQSGNLSCPWAVGQSRAENGFKLASLLGKDSTDPKEVVEFLQTVPAEKILKAQANILSAEEKNAYRLAFGLNCDDKAKNPVLPLPIEELMKRDSNIPIMAGYLSHEFIMFLKDTSDEAMNVLEQHLSQHVTNFVNSQMLKNVDIGELTRRVRDWYFDGKSIDKSQIPSYIDFASDVYFTVPTKRLMNDLRKKTNAPLYMYQFSYLGNETTITDLLLEKRQTRGATHSDELSYMHYIVPCKDTNTEAPAVGTKDRTALERTIALWSNFAKTGNPTPSTDDCVKTVWKPVTKNDFQYFDIGDDLRMLATTPSVLGSL